jgi:hypothetical protein
MQWKRTIACWIIVFAFLAHAPATTVIPPTFEEMADRADVVFAGKALNARSEWRMVGTRRVIFTSVEFEVTEVLKGAAGRSITLQFLGGTIGDTTLEVAGTPRFATGERVILFVEKNGTRFSPIVGVFHGKFGVQRDAATGRDTVVQHDGKPLRAVAEIGHGEGVELARGRAKVSLPANHAPLSVDDFKAQVRGHLASRALRK